MILRDESSQGQQQKAAGKVELDDGQSGSVLSACKDITAEKVLDEESHQNGDKDTSPLSAKEWRSLRWRLDMRIMFLFAMLYMWSAMDRSNIGNAKLGNILHDLDIPDATYSVAMSIFFVGYIIFQVPSNLILKKLGANLWMSGLVTLTGVIVACTAAIKNGSGLLATRFFLGIAETGLFPGTVYYFSIWYTRSEQGKRFSIYYASAAVAGAIGGLLAYGIMRMDGVRGMHGWQWLFLIEALPTIVLGIATYFILPGFPGSSKALTERERAALMQRLEADWGANGNNTEDETSSSSGDIRSAFTDWKMYYMAFICFFGSSVFYGLTLFLPSIVKEMGFASLEAQAMTVPPYVVACICMIVSGIDADRRLERGFHVACSSFVGMLGFILLATCQHKGPAALYVFACMAVAGAYSQFTVFISWASNNFGGRTKRAVATAFVAMGGNIGGAVAGQMYRANDVGYVRGHSACAALLFCHVVLVLLFKYLLTRINKKRENLTINEYNEASKRYERSSDWHPNFRYIT